jgi:L-asparaginase
VFRYDVARRPALTRPERIDVRVPLVVATVGDDGALLDSIGSGCAGLVVAGFGVGHVPESWAERLGALAQRIPVVLASRIGAGPVLTHTYGAPGSETDLRNRGVITCGNLNAYQARLLLLVLLSNGETDVRSAFAQWLTQQ